MKAAPKKRTPQPIPHGYEGATPYLCVKGAAAALDFYKRAFAATETMRIAQPDGRIGHAEIRVGQAVIMLADEFPEMHSRSPSSLGGSPVTLHLYVADVDLFAKRAAAAGMRVLVESQLYGDRGGRFEDPFGHVWWVATHQGGGNKKAHGFSFPREAWLIHRGVPRNGPVWSSVVADF